MDDRPWWSRRWFLISITILTAVPLLLPESPPLVDLPGHLGRYRVQLDLSSSPELQRYFNFQWQLAGNLGMDLLIVPVARVFGLELGLKLLVLAIPPLTTAAIFLLAAEIHGRVPPTALFAVPFVYNFPFIFGFINFALSMAFALLAFILWLRITKRKQWHVRSLVFALLSCGLWITHAFGWALLVVLICSAEYVRYHHDRGLNWTASAVRSALACAPVVILPGFLMIVWRNGMPSGLDLSSFNLTDKVYAVIVTLRDRWFLWDVLGIGVGLAAIAFALLHRRVFFAQDLAIAAALLTLLFLLLPHTLWGSVFADTRIVAYIMIIAIVTLRLEDSSSPSVSRSIAVLGLLFVLGRIAATTLSFAIADREMKDRLAALAHIPVGAPVLSLVGDPCTTDWSLPRYWHAGSFVIVRRSGFSNDQWQVAGAHSLSVAYRQAGKFTADPSQVVHPIWCLAALPPGLRHLGQTTENVLRTFPREAFGYVWVIRAPDLRPGPRPGLTPVWRGADSVLYKVDADGA